MNVTLVAVDDVQFVGSTGGAKILEIILNDNFVDTSGVIYDKIAFFKYSITL